MSRTILLARALTILAFLFVPLAAPVPAKAAGSPRPDGDPVTYTVNTTDDDPIWGACTATHCSLRQAIFSAESNSGPAIITFNIPGDPPYVIALRSGLSVIRSDLTIDGTTEPDYRTAPVVVLDGGALPGSGLVIFGRNTIVRGLSLINFPAAINIGAAQGTIIESNYIGLGSDGEPHGNDTGIRIDGSEITVSNNVISSNETGIVVAAGSDEVIRGNLIGTNPAGDTAMGNATGIRLEGSARRVLIGGDDWRDRNVISGSTLYGIHDVSDLPGDNVINNNRIGTDILGRSALPNAIGIYRPTIHSSGGSLTIQGNVISGNATGVWLSGVNHLVEHNRIGIDPLGARAVPNTQVGIHIEGCLGCQVIHNVISGNPTGVELFDGPGLERDSVIAHNYIGTDVGLHVLFPNGTGIDIEGGTGTVIESNTIGGNDVGLRLGGGEATVRYNFIGVDATGRPPALPNGTGIQVGLGAGPSTIGGSSEADGNLIAFNTGDGILSSGGGGFAVTVNKVYQNGGHGIHINAGRAEPPPEGVGIPISGNSIYDNGGLGIRIENPALVADLLPPQLTRASSSSVSGTTEPGALVEVFLAAPDPSGSGEGKTYVVYLLATADGSFTVPVTGTGSCPVYTATVRDPAGNTSEFSVNRATCLALRPLAAVIWILGAAGGGSAFTVILRRRPLSLRTLPWLLIGGLLGAGIGILLLRLPFVQINAGQPGAQPAPPNAPGNLPAPITLTPLLEISVTPVTPAPGPEAMALVDANCRRGPLTEFGVATHLRQGQVVPITGRLAQSDWWQVQPTNMQIPCWIASGVVETYGDLSVVPIVVAPLLPTPTPTDEPVSPAQGCKCWNGNVYICTVPCPNYCKGGPCTP